MKSAPSAKSELPAALGGSGYRYDPEIVSCRALVIDSNPTSNRMAIVL